jgi:ABC-type branched-subunit amino acid transport system permease subunit
VGIAFFAGVAVVVTVISETPEASLSGISPVTRILGGGAVAAFLGMLFGYGTYHVGRRLRRLHSLRLLRRSRV